MIRSHHHDDARVGAPMLRLHTDRFAALQETKALCCIHARGLRHSHHWCFWRLRYDTTTTLYGFRFPRSPLHFDLHHRRNSNLRWVHAIGLDAYVSWIHTFSCTGCLPEPHYSRLDSWMALTVCFASMSTSRVRLRYTPITACFNWMAGQVFFLLGRYSCVLWLARGKSLAALAWHSM